MRRRGERWRGADQSSGLVAALAELRAVDAGLFLVAKRDRLARDVVVAALIERDVAAAGARVAAADGAGNGATPSDALMRGMLDLFARAPKDP